MKRFLAILFLTFALAIQSLSAFATDIDLKASEFKWRGKKVTGEHFGRIYLKSAKLTQNENIITGGEFVMDMKNFTVDDLDGDFGTKLSDHLKSADFLDVAKFSTAKLVISELKGATAKGNLTIKDQTQPIEIKFTKEGDTYSGKMVFDRTKFGMIYGSGSFFKELGDKLIYNEVELTFKVVLQH